ncbi:MAG: hypothetical protein WDW36_001758 [Sanguina aurantia]
MLLTAAILAVASAQSIVPAFVADVSTTVPWSVVAPVGGQTFTQGGSLGTGVTAFTSLDMVTHDIWANNPMDPRIADLRTNILMPEQISVTINTPTQMVFSWVTNVAQNLFSNTSNPMPVALQAQASIVSYSTNASNLNQYSVYGTQTQYNQTYAFTTITPSTPWYFTNYQSPLIHHALVSGLMANTTYYYTVGDGAGNTSPMLQFKTPQAVGLNFPMRIAVAADVGNTFNSSVTFSHMLASNADLVLLIGDLAYADHYSSTGAVAAVTGSYQPIWDQEGRLMQPLLSQIPYLNVPGNHEAEYANGASGKVLPNNTMFGQNAFNSWWNRYGMALPTPATGSQVAPWYSTNVGPAHIIGLSAYISTMPGSAQYTWLAADLAAVDRTVTPWIIVQMHPPLYNTLNYHYKAADCQRANLEVLFYQYGVDIYVAGHVHSYERTNKVNNYTVDACGTSHFTMGDGGNVENLRAVYVTSADGVVNGTVICGAVTAPFASDLLPDGACLSYQASDTLSTGIPSACPIGQPAYSAFREPSFGHGTIDIINATTALWQWHRNQDGEATVSDVKYLYKSTGCANQGASLAGYINGTISVFGQSNVVPAPTAPATYSMAVVVGTIVGSFFGGVLVTVIAAIIMRSCSKSVNSRRSDSGIQVMAKPV